jgi:hypothetical protein
MSQLVVYEMRDYYVMEMFQSKQKKININIQ